MSIQSEGSPKLLDLSSDVSVVKFSVLTKIIQNCLFVYKLASIKRRGSPK